MSKDKTPTEPKIKFQATITIFDDGTTHSFIVDGKDTHETIELDQVIEFLQRIYIKNFRAKQQTASPNSEGSTNQKN